MTKPLEQMTVEELRIETMNYEIDDLLAFDELARRNKLLVEALEEISRLGWIHEGTTSMDCAKVADEAIKQSEGEL